MAYRLDQAASFYEIIASTDLGSDVRGVQKGLVAGIFYRDLGTNCVLVSTESDCDSWLESSNGS